LKIEVYQLRPDLMSGHPCKQYALQMRGCCAPWVVQIPSFEETSQGAPSMQIQCRRQEDSGVRKYKLISPDSDLYELRIYMPYM
jgi:hypothetical protein